MSSAREAAKHFIQKYVDRDSSEEGFKYLRDGHMTSSSPGSWCCSIGGYMHPGENIGAKDRCYTADYILVKRDIQGRRTDEVFRLRDIFEDCKQGQQALL